MKWTQRFFRDKNSIIIIEPKESGDYWVTDGWYAHKAHFMLEADGERWGIYQPDERGIMVYCYALADMNFHIVAFAKMSFPKIPIRFQDL